MATALRNLFTTSTSGMKDHSQQSLREGESLIRTYACTGPNKPLQECAFILPGIGEDEVDVRVQFCGVCHTDVSYIKNEKGKTVYPFAPGHEIIGIVEQKGRNVPDDIQLNQRVGVGALKSSCNECEFCTSGRANLCRDAVKVFADEGNMGGFSEVVRLDRRWVIPIPDGIESADAAPLLCAGATVYAPLIRYGVGEGTKLGLIGFGGLGHLLVQMAVALGADVTVFSTSSEKEEDAITLGADKFVRLDKMTKEQENEFNLKLDILFNTAYAELDWNKMLEMVKPGGVFCILGAPQKGARIELDHLIHYQKTIAGSMWSSQGQLRDMLNFCVEHKIKPETELHQVRESQSVIEKFEKEGMYYRAVLQVDGGFEHTSCENSKKVLELNKGG